MLIFEGNVYLQYVLKVRRGELQHQGENIVCGKGERNWNRKGKGDLNKYT